MKLFLTNALAWRDRRKTWPWHRLRGPRRKVVTADLGKHESAEHFIFAKSEAGVERELHIVGAGKLPRIWS